MPIKERKKPPRPSYPERDCDFCHTNFKPTSYWQIYCTSDCRIAAFAVRRIEARKAGLSYATPQPPADMQERIAQARGAAVASANLHTIKSGITDMEVGPQLDEAEKTLEDLGPQAKVKDTEAAMALNKLGYGTESTMPNQWNMTSKKISTRGDANAPLKMEEYSDRQLSYTLAMLRSQETLTPGEQQTMEDILKEQQKRKDKDNGNI